VDSTKRVALITGANKGIGYEIARQLGQQEITVLVGSRDAERGEEAVACLRDQQLDAHMIVIDVTDSSSVQHAASEIEERFGRQNKLAIGRASTPSRPYARPSRPTCSPS
jgi:NAD(P)-dependent dehydrogenase (short-subunit alcohol dehydrogenase family)